MILETDIDNIAYITAWNRQEHRECGRIVLMEIALGIRTPAPCSGISVADDQADYDGEAEKHGVTVRELLGYSS